MRVHVRVRVRVQGWGKWGHTIVRIPKVCGEGAPRVAALFVLQVAHARVRRTPNLQHDEHQRHTTTDKWRGHSAAPLRCALTAGPLSGFRLMILPVSSVYMIKPLRFPLRAMTFRPWLLLALRRKEHMLSPSQLQD